ncbi:cellobiose phosphotransferase ydjC-like family protein [Candidatus Termititenax persephonae]|uniref:Cellobiose phosphotransferase ydjC-like family protein n=1 Tax=Candidatus Termititenax persephonae TaxID=2218525 RepID=A0A388TEF4_9BACT|nr:cellobiose phosphotransferase ydjC-like family protein [Candidatus Termititenax persephonae]
MNIIINSDDFGISASANQAIAALHKKGVISSATLLVDLPYAKDAAELAKKQNIPVGLHFNLTLGPLAKYKGRADFERQLALGRVSIRLLKEELARQYNKFLSFGLTPTHLDTHQHIHNWPLIFPVFARFAQKHKMPLRLVLEKPVFNRYAKLQDGDCRQLIRKLVFLIFGWLNLLTAKLLRVKTNRSLTSVLALWPRPAQLEIKHLRLLLQKSRNNTEYMCHPIVSAENTPTAITETSVREYDLMTNPEFFAMLNNRHNLISFGGL